MNDDDRVDRYYHVVSDNEARGDSQLLCRNLLPEHVASVGDLIDIEVVERRWINHRVVERMWCYWSNIPHECVLMVTVVQ